MSNMISQSLLPEFDMEMASTRRVRERVPESQGAFRPHQKSMTMARLAWHVAEMPLWTTMTLSKDGLDMNPGDGPRQEAYTLTSTESQPSAATSD